MIDAPANIITLCMMAAFFGFAWLMIVIADLAAKLLERWKKRRKRKPNARLRAGWMMEDSSWNN